MTIKNHLPSLFGSDNRGYDVFHNLQNEVDRVFGQFRTRWPASLDEGPSSGSGDMALTPRVNVAETDQAIEVEAELPGFESKDIVVTSLERSLVLEASKSEEKKEDKKNYHVIERSSGHYRRVIPLGFDFDADTVKARCKDGVLTITVPKPAEVRQSAKKIAVETA